MIQSSHPPSLRDIARFLGVSSTTVSMALRDHPRISASTRERVKEAAGELGYRPNAELSRVMIQMKTRGRNPDTRPVVALVTPHERGDPSGLELFTRFQDIAETAGYAADRLCLGTPVMRYSRMGDILRARGVRAALLYRVGGSAPASDDWLGGLCVCCVGSPPEGALIPSCDWEEPGGGSGGDVPLLRAAMDLLDFRIQRNRPACDGYGMNVTLVATKCEPGTTFRSFVLPSEHSTGGNEGKGGETV